MLEPPPYAPDLFNLPGFHEPFSAFSHLFGFAAFSVMGTLLLRKGWGDARRATALAVFAIASVLQMAMSSLFHMMERGGAASHVFERLDHAAIFILIAATYTPAHFILFRGWKRWMPLAIVWTAALCGLLIKVVFFRVTPEWVGLLMYFMLGGGGLISIALIARRHHFHFVAPLLWGGFAYSVGAVIDFLRWPLVIPHVMLSHDLFHLAVLAGLTCHWLFTWRFADWEMTPHAPPKLRRPRTISSAMPEPA